MKSESDYLYEMFKQVDEERKKRNINAFFSGLKGGLICDLDDAYSSGDSVRYNRLVTNIKQQGMRIYRNSDGKHKIKIV